MATIPETRWAYLDRWTCRFEIREDGRTLETIVRNVDREGKIYWKSRKWTSSSGRSAHYVFQLLCDCYEPEILVWSHAGKLLASYSAVTGGIQWHVSMDG